MATAPALAVTTADQLLAMAGDGVRHELVDGEVRQMAPAGFEHGQVALSIGALVREHVRSRGLGVVVAAETGFRLGRDPDTVRAPDAAFVAADRLAGLGRLSGYLDLAPDLVVEVVSPSDRAADVVEKARAWLAAGTRLVWVVYPAQHLVVVHEPSGTARHLSGADRLDGGDVLPGFEVEVASVFA